MRIEGNLATINGEKDTGSASKDMKGQWWREGEIFHLPVLLSRGLETRRESVGMIISQDGRVESRGVRWAGCGK